MNRSVGVLERKDCRIHYEVAGDGPPIVFAHGLGGNHLSWWQQVAHFARSHTCVVFSHRGFPPSGAVPGERAPDAYADDLAALIEHLDLEDVALVGQSMGGWTCLEYALREPRRVRSLVMASTSGTLDYRLLKDKDVDEWLRLAPGMLAGMQARGILPASGERMAREQPAAAQLYWQIYQLTPSGFREAVRKRIGELRSRPPSLLEQLRVPVLFLTGEEDWVFPPAAGPALAKLAPRGEAVRVPAAGHSVYFERAALFNESTGRVL
ncbi:MAG TPA: alpha/beta hydrolase [Burkholderiales bacterium]|nr:alpha/beta hydrolase [Burkholderiales bacterium]